MAPKVSDLEDMVIKWAWQQFTITRGKEHSSLQYKDLKFTVNWDRVRFVSDIPDFSDKEQLEVPHSQVVFKSVYENRTDNMQEHQFQTDRCTVSSCSTNITKGFTKGMNLELKLGLPNEVMSATAGFGREVTMESSQDWTKEESVSWSINSTIKVPKKHRTTAELVVKEQVFTATFHMVVRIRGVVVVAVTNLKDNNSFVKSIENQFCEVMRDHVNDSGGQFQISGKNVVWNVTGTCKFRFGIEQHVQLDEKSLEDEEA